MNAPGRCPDRSGEEARSPYLDFLKRVGDHGNEHVEQDDDDDEGEDAIQDPPYELGQRELRHVHVVLVGHPEHGPEQEVERLIEPAAAGRGYYHSETAFLTIFGTKYDHNSSWIRLRA